MIEAAKFTAALLDWYAQNKRDLPWRHTTDPYKVWISEVMLQQTQVDRVAANYYPRFLEKFPTVESLAAVDWDTVYPFWRGLGFYRRGKNMLKAAKIVQEKYNGVFPNEIAVLQDLPGIGTYTAAAICSFAYDQKTPSIDTNLEKIIHTLWPSSNLLKQAHELIKHAPSGRDWNSAMMDLATTLRKKEELTGDIAQFFPEEIAAKFIPKRNPRPKKKLIKKRRKNIPRIEVGIACIHKDNRYLIQTRPVGKSFPGQWEFPGGKREKGEDFRTCVKREVQEELGIEVSVRPHFLEVIHNFDSVDLVLRFHRCQIQKGEPKSLEKQKFKWVKTSQFDTITFLDTNKEVLKKLKTFGTKNKEESKPEK